MCKADLSGWQIQWRVYAPTECLDVSSVCQVLLVDVWIFLFTAQKLTQWPCKPWPELVVGSWLPLLCLLPLPICSSQVPCMFTQYVNLIFYCYVWFKSALGHAVLQQNADFSAQLWLGVAGQELLQPTVTLTSASCHAQASFVLLHDAYLAFPHGPALPLRTWLHHETPDIGQDSSQDPVVAEELLNVALWGWK